MQHQKKNLSHDSGVSEIIGSVMLISVVVVAVAVVGVVLTSQGTPQKVPALSAVISNVGRTVYVYHDGGDALQHDEMYIMVNGQTQNFSKSGDPNWNSWSVGESLSYLVPGTDPINTVAIVYGATGSSALLASANFGEKGMPTAVPTPTVAPHTITASSSAGGTISPSGLVSVNDGASQAFTITANPGYHIVDVLVDSSSVGAVPGYTFTNVVADHTIAASFALNAPTFVSITPNTGTTLGGTAVTIVGTNFVSGGLFGVTIGGTAATSVVWVDSAHITAVTPAGTTGARNVVITNNDGQTATGTGAYTYVAPAAPTFVSITPNTGTTLGGTAVTIVGTNFVSGGLFGVTIGGTAATSVVWVDSAHITAVTPAGTTGARDVVITNNDGQTATGTGAYTYAAVPTVTGISPTTGPTAGGTSVIVTGTGFTGANNVKFGVTANATGAMTVNSDTQITVTSPAGSAGTVHVTVTTPGGTSATSSSDQFTYTIPITAIGAITGTPQVGSVLTAGALTPSGATATFQWQRSLTSGGTYTAISGATSTTYTPVAGDIGYYIQVVATGTGSYTGTVTSAYVGPVGGISITAIGAITGTPQVGSVLTAGALTPSGATATYQWQRSTTSGGTYTAISGATSSTYTPVAGDGGYYIKVAATGTGSYTGTVTSAYTGPVTIIPVIQTFSTVGGPFTSTVPQGAIYVDYLVVAGGGGGGRYGGGGGAGGFRTGTLTGLSSSYTVTVGGGGAGSTLLTTRGTNGGVSVFASVTAAGGGGGGSDSGTLAIRTGADGGSGGGGERSTGLGGAGNTPSVSPSQGNNGGAGARTNAYTAGGGGGAGAAGSAGTNNNGGDGGAGTASSITDVSVTYAGGGGGGCNAARTAAGSGGAGGGGAGGDGVAGTAGTNGLGGGGGGSGNTGNGGNGGSGIVIIKYY